MPEVGATPAKTPALAIAAVGDASARAETSAGARELSLDALDRMFHACQGQLTAGASPLALTGAAFDWALHQANAPFRSFGLVRDGWLMAGRLAGGLFDGPVVETDPTDHRFSHPGWSRMPFSASKHAFLLGQEWLDRLTQGAPGVSPENQRLLQFAARQWFDAWSPSNVPFLNPEVIEKTQASAGSNLLRGAGRMADDAIGSYEPGRAEPEPDLKVGRDLAITPGEVVTRNELFELIQYGPLTDHVRAEPVLIVPAWIMKYYVLDLRPQNSLVRFLVERGYTVFCMSWRNPGPEMADTPFDAYRRDGLLAALDAVEAIVPGAKPHAVGYCLGGTLLSIGAAALARDHEDRLASLTLLCSQVDFTEAGELQLFTTEDQVDFLDDVLSVQGVLDGKQMGGAFRMLRSRDLVWSALIKTYWLGEPEHPNDLMTWNEDATRMPHRMYIEYVRELYLDNHLAEGRLLVEGRPVSVGDIRLPVFAVGTETDHVAPWRSVFKIQMLNPGEITFALTTGGHNAGIVNEPGHPHRSYRLSTRPAGGPFIGPEEWLANVPSRPGSWWPAWEQWLSARSSPVSTPPPTMGAPEAGYPPLEPAPGRYVLEK
jgi:polyhydroxyalkanoate synthase